MGRASVCLAAACLALLGCRDRAGGSPASTPSAPAMPAPAAKRLRIAMIAKSATNPVFLAARTGAEDQARALSASLGMAIEIEWLTPPDEGGGVQAQRIAQAVQEKVDAILISCSDADQVTPAIDDAVAHGVAVMTFDSDAPRSKRFAYCGVDDLKAGEAVMEELARQLPHGSRFAVLAGNASAPNLQRRVAGVMREAARHPDLKSAGTFFHLETPEDASAEVIREQTAHPDIRGWAMVGGWALYTRTLLHHLGEGDAPPPGPPRPKLVSINALPAQLVYVEHGLAPVLLAQPTYLWGEVGVKTIVDKLVRKRPVPERIPMELVRVTAENLPGWVRQLRAWGFADTLEEHVRNR